MDSSAITHETQKAGAEYRYAGFWLRLLATIIDWIFLGIIGFVLFGSEVTSVSGGSVGVNFEGYKMIVPALYTLIFWLWRSATPGKMICGTKIISEDGTKLDWKKAIIRLFSYLVSAIPLMLGFLVVPFDKKKQGWHDKIAKTYVVKI